MQEEKTEVERNKDILNQEIGRIDVYDRLLLNPDFQIFEKELIDKKVEMLFDMLETSEEKDLGRIRGQIEALRGIKKIFRFTLARKGEIRERMNLLNKGGKG